MSEDTNIIGALSQKIIEKDAEIERLKEELKKRVSTRYCEIQDEAYTEAMFEIERLKAQIHTYDQNGVRDLVLRITALEARVEVQRQVREDDKQLITELADALETWVGKASGESASGGILDDGRALVQRAREASKDE